MYEPSFAKELGQRAARQYMIEAKGGVAFEQQKQIGTVGEQLKKARCEKLFTVEEIAQSLDIKPSLLCFLEQGWGTPVEFSEVLDRWVNILDQDIQVYHHQLSFLPFEDVDE